MTVKITATRTIDELRVEITKQESYKNILMCRTLKLAGHVQRMGDENWA